MLRTGFLTLGLSLSVFSLSQAAFGIRADGRLDQKDLREAYTDGDFDKVKAALEQARKRTNSSPSREDRIFTDKYLGVIYAADSATLTRAESHFNLLLEEAPQIELADMYVSARVQAFFERVKTDFQKNKNYIARYDEYGNPIGPQAGKPPASRDAPPPAGEKKGSGDSVLKKREGSGAWLWAGLATAAVGAGTGYYLVTRSKPSPAPDKITLVQGKPDP